MRKPFLRVKIPMFFVILLSSLKSTKIWKKY
nr:MAG TPA: hypothetical protein [Bacteriophage sp.]